MPKKSSKKSKLQDVWGERTHGMEVPAIDLNKPVTHEDVLYLLQQYPFLQMISSNPNWEESIFPKFHTVSNGWVIHDYGQAMSASPGAYLYGPGNPDLLEKQKEEGKEEDEDSGGGSIIVETVDTAAAMINLAIEKGWPGVEIIAGTDLMKWAAWFAAQDLNYLLKGYEPTEDEKAKRERILRLRSESAGPVPQPGAGA